MPQWEYLVVTLDSENRFSKVVLGQVRGVNGAEVNEWRKSGHYVEGLNELGAENWELVASTGHFEGTVDLIFKRPSLQTIRIRSRRR